MPVSWKIYCERNRRSEGVFPLGETLNFLSGGTGEVLRVLHWAVLAERGKGPPMIRRTVVT